MNFIQTSGNGRFAPYNGVSRFGIAFDVFQVFQSFISPNYFTIVTSGTACPSSTTYNWMMVRQRTPDSLRGASSANSTGLTAGGVMNYSSSNSTFTGVSDFNLVGPTLNTSTAYGITGYNSATCASGTNLGESTGTSSLDEYWYMFYGANSFVGVSADGNPEVIIGAPQQTLTTSSMSLLSPYTFTGIATEFINDTTQTQTNAFFVPNAAGTTFAINQATSLTNPFLSTNIGTLTCTSLNTPTTGFCTGTLSIVGVSGTGKAVCLISSNTSQNLMMCAAEYPGSPTLPYTIIAQTSAQAVLQVAVSPTVAQVAAKNNTTQLIATVTNLTSRYIPLMELPTTPADDLVAPWSDTGAFSGGANCSSTLDAYASCTFPVTFTGTATKSTVIASPPLYVQYNNGVSTPLATANLIGTTGLKSIAITPSDTYVAQGGSQIYTVTATYTGGSTQNVTTAVTWSSSNTGVATVNAGTANWVSDGTATITATLGTSSDTDNVTVVSTPVLTSISNYNFPSTYINQGQAFSFDFNNVANGTPGNDTNMTYACVYNQTYNGVFSPGTPCTSLPGTATFNTTTGVFAWTPSVAAWGPYQFQITGTLDGTFSTTETFYIDVRPAYSLTNLRGSYDAQFANLTTPYSSANYTWKDLTTNGFDGTLNNDANGTWVGSGTASSPYALSLNGSAVVDFGSSLMASQTKMMFGVWISPSSATSLNKVILTDSGDGTGNGFTLRQASSNASYLELLVGQLSGSYKSTVLSSSPIGYWQLNETTGTTVADVSGDNNTGTINGGITKGATGPVTGVTAMTFNGTSGYISAARPTTNTSNWTLEAWVNITAFAGGTDETGMVVYNGDDSGGYGIGVGHSGTNNDLYVLYGGVAWIDMGTLLTTGTWYHLVAVNNGGTLTAYVNGVAAPNTSGNTPAAVDNYFGIGWEPNHVSRYFNGTIGEVAVYNAPLTAAQVLSHYNARSGIYDCISASTFTNSQWNFISGIWDGSYATLYVDGHAECTYSTANSITTPVSDLFAGATSGGLANSWTGQIADLQVYGTTGASPGTATDVNTNFTATADRFRATPQGNLVTSNLVLNLDAANANHGLYSYASGCSATELSWWDLSVSGILGTLTSFTGCGATTGWQGTGAATSPYRIIFNGTSDYVNLSSSSTLYSATNPMTITAWVNPTSLTNVSYAGGGLEGGTIVDSNESGGTSGYMFGIKSTGVLYWWPYANGDAYSTGTVSTNAWTYVALTYDGTNVRFYLNDALDSTHALSAPQTPTFMKIGNEAWVTGQYQGAIATVSIYNAALTQAQLAQNCNAQVARFSGGICH